MFDKALSGTGPSGRGKPLVPVSGTFELEEVVVSGMSLDFSEGTTTSLESILASGQLSSFDCSGSSIPEIESPSSESLVVDQSLRSDWVSSSLEEPLSGSSSPFSSVL